MKNSPLTELVDCVRHMERAGYSFGTTASWVTSQFPALRIMVDDQARSLRATDGQGGQQSIVWQGKA